MAIQKMQYINIMGPISRFDWMVEHCIVPYSFEPVKNAVEAGKERQIMLPFEEANPYDEMVENLERCLSVAGLAPETVENRKKAQGVYLSEEEIHDFHRIMTDLGARRDALRQELGECEELMKQLAPLKEMNIAFDQLFSMEFIDVRLGRMPISSYQKLVSYGKEARLVFVPVTIEKTVVWGIAFAARSEHEEAVAFLSSLYFQRVYIPNSVHDDPQTACQHTEERLSEIRLELSEISRDMQRQINEHKEMLCQAYLYYHHLQACFDLRKYAHKSDHLFSISGWLRKRDLKPLKKMLDADQDMMLVTENPEDNQNLKPPTRLKNLPVIRYFQMFVEMYGLPSYGEIDPTFFVAVTYTLFFGIMFGDLGQGLVLCLAGILMWKKMKMPLGRIVSVIGVSSAIGGIFFGSVFGLEELLPGFGVLKGNNPLYILLFAAGFGLVLIALAMSLNIINGIRKKDPGQWLFSPNGLMGALLFFGNVAAGLTLLLAKKNIWSPLYLTLTTFVPLLALFLAAPLTRLMRREPHWMPEKAGEFIAESFFELFEVLLSYLSNTISYVRIGAFAISHAGMMLVVTNMAQMVGGTVGTTLVMIFGNIFVIGLEGLIVGIQCLRLQFYEFFSRFYSGGGRAFAPVNLKNNNGGI